MFELSEFLVKEQVKFLKSHQTYDIYDAITMAQVGTAEENISGFTKLLRWFVSRALMPTTVEVREKPDDALIFTIKRGMYIFRSRVEVLDSNGDMIGYFKSKVFTIGGGFHIYDSKNTHIGEVKGNIIGFNYRVLSPDHLVELGKVNKKWGGFTKEIFTSADTYYVGINPDLRENPIVKILVLAAALATDMIFKSESKGTVDLGE